jgi:large subunit ribosomal protein L25
MAELALSARPRTVLGKKVRALRRSGIAPANIYGRNVPSLAIEADAHDLALLLRRAGRTNLIQVNVEGEAQPRPVLIRDYTRRATTDQLLHVEFFQVSMREKLSVDVPIVIVGVAPVVDQGNAVVVQSMDTVSVECLPSDIPDRVEADIAVLVETTSNVYVRDLRVPAGVEILTDPDLPVVSVSVVASAEEEDAAAAEAVETAEAAEAEAAEAEAAEAEPDEQS